MININDIYRPHVATEDELFNIAKKAIPSLIRTTDRFSPVDAISHEKNLAIEFKSKNEHYDTMMILEDKYEALQVYQNNRYICATPEGIFSFNFKKITKPEFNIEKHKCTTNSEIGYMEWCQKSVAYLAISASTRITIN